ncbi:Zn(2+)-responsive transcriptional regulator [Hafnia paralvei]|uniref:Zn(2+)-responsive transcriptional regulator n=1 Tax=Hafnia paralvei TaxID=546367 RepID=UPI001034E0D6|nr:Zn(2+)-responsive transcriptional regulator [Hafnia paralvei]TBL57664.1 Zn(2+)-responsive transcriptional regulator [Hafnia paralvei]
MYRIGQLAKLAGVTPDTVRYYEKQKMMDHEVRTESGYRLYTDHDLQRLRFIRYAKQLGFTLESIRELLSIRVDPKHHTCQESKSIVDARLLEVESKIHELELMRQSLRRLSDACCGKAHTSTYCSILEALEQGAAERLMRIDLRSYYPKPSYC